MHKKEQNRLFLGLLLISVWFRSCAIGTVYAQASLDMAKTYPVLPFPKEVSYGNELLYFNGIRLCGTVFAAEGGKLIDFFESQHIPTTFDGLSIRFEQNTIPGTTHPEAYELRIDSTVVLTATTEKGAFYGIQTLKQLVRKKGAQGTLPYVRITDWPTFKIRGFMHDTGRNYQSVAQLKEQIAILALYKYNTFHWHLTDNPGWRLESKKYPQLQYKKAFSRDIGDYYTQADFKEILAYCKDRHITVIPEFDVPGHTDAFRKAFGFKTMKEPRVLPILLDLFEELCNLADAKEMPYIHIGTDEVRHRSEEVSERTILAIMELLKAKNREVITWKEGIHISGDSTSIKQLWAQHPPKEGHRFIDSRANYINHLDPFAGMGRLFFQQPTRQAQGDSLALGGILCAWPDNDVAYERDILKQNPIYPSMVFYADAIWNGRKKDHLEYWANLPMANTPELKAFRKLEEAVLVHKTEFFKGKEFPYVKQTDIQWQLIGPFDHKNSFSKSFPVEDVIKEEYLVNDKTYTWQGPYVGGTIHLKHFFGFPALTECASGTYYAYTEIYSPDNRIQDFWIGFQGWSRSGGRRGGPFPEQGEWHTTEPKLWVNKTVIEPPIWKQPGLKTNTDEIPFVDEDYFYREPTKIALKKGWNTVLLKVPHGGNSWKWMFSCVPIDVNEHGEHIAPYLKYRTKISDRDQK